MSQSTPETAAQPHESVEEGARYFVEVMDGITGKTGGYPWSRRHVFGDTTNKEAACDYAEEEARIMRLPHRVRVVETLATYQP